MRRFTASDVVRAILPYFFGKVLQRWQQKKVDIFSNFPGMSRIFEIPEFSEVARIFPGFRGENVGGFFAVSGCNRLYTPQK